MFDDQSRPIFTERNANNKNVASGKTREGAAYPIQANNL
jgi:hypothetical protein